MPPRLTSVLLFYHRLKPLRLPSIHAKLSCSVVKHNKSPSPSSFVRNNSMSDTEQKTPNKTGASGAAWSDAEKIAYLIVLCENEGKVDAKIATAPIPAGRSLVSCKKLLVRLKEKHKDDIAKIKAGQVLTAASASGGGEATPEKPKTPRKRKAKANTEGDGEDNDEGSPKKKTAGRKKKGEATTTKEGLKEEDVDEELQV